MKMPATDAELRWEALDALRYDVRIDEANLNVDVTQGEVHLTGTVPTYFQKNIAGHNVQRLKDVRSVTNDLDVSLGGAWADVEIAKVVRGTLNHDARISDASQIDIGIAGGVVTLHGTVCSAAERAYAAGDAWIAPGTVDVVNDISVVPGQARPDADIAVDVHSTLVSDLSIGPRQIDAKVRDGIVFLEGTVRSEFDKHQAQHDAWCVAGVRDVVNELQIAA